MLVSELSWSWQARGGRVTAEQGANAVASPGLGAARRSDSEQIVRHTRRPRVVWGASSDWAGRRRSRGSRHAGSALRSTLFWMLLCSQATGGATEARIAGFEGHAGSRRHRVVDIGAGGMIHGGAAGAGHKEGEAGGMSLYLRSQQVSRPRNS